MNSGNTKLKICGILSLEEAEELQNLEIDYLGCIFAKSPRQVTVELASKITYIAHRKKKKTVGVFVNETIENIVKIMVAENPDFYNGFTKRRAIVANRKHQFPAFQESNLEQRQYFSSKYKMRIQFEAEIIIK